MLFGIRRSIITNLRFAMARLFASGPFHNGWLPIAGLAAGISCSLILSGSAIAQYSNTVKATLQSKRTLAAKKLAPRKDTGAHPTTGTPPPGRPTMPIDQATMMDAGSLLTLNGATFPVGLTS